MLQNSGFEVLHFPAVFVKPEPPCKGYEGLRLAARNVLRTILYTNTSMAIMEDDLALHRRYKARSREAIGNQICRFVEESRERGADVAYLGYLVGDHVKWGTHALWVTPNAAQYLLRDTARCFQKEGDSTDSSFVGACRKRHLACTYATEPFQKEHHSGGRHGFLGFFIQDRLKVRSYLHSPNNAAINHAQVAQKALVLR